MKRWVEGAGEPGEVEWSEIDEGLRFTYSENGVRGAEREATVVEVEEGIYSVLAAGRSYEVKIVPAPEGWAVDVDGQHFVLSVTDPREGGRSSREASHAGPVRLSVPMPGRVIKVLAAAGDAVEAGQGLIVVEAMKMQNEVKTPRAGRVIALPAAVGAAVTPGQVLAVIE